MINTFLHFTIKTFFNFTGLQGLMYLRNIFFLILYSCFTITAAAQQFAVKGIVYKKNSPDRVAQVLVTNLKTNATRISDDLGRFEVQAATGDTLVFKKIDYAAEYYVVYGTLDVNIYLQPNILLDQVNIKEQTKKQEIDDMMKLYKNQGGYYTLKPSAWSLINSPLTGFYELFGQAPNRARRFQEHTQEEMDHVEINKRYTAALITKVTGLTDEKEIKAFKDAFTPALEDIKTWNDYELINYIKRSYDYYTKNKNQLKLPRLY